MVENRFIGCSEQCFLQQFPDLFSEILIEFWNFHLMIVSKNMFWNTEDLFLPAAG